MLRGIFLALSQNRLLRRFLEGSFAAKRLTSRFVAGRELADGLAVARTLAAGGMQTALDHLGENVTTLDEARQAAAAAHQALDELTKLSIQGTIAIKLTQLGLDLSTEACLTALEPLVALARERGTRVEIDMESTAYTERTLEIVEAMHAKYGSVRAVIQAYLHRSEGDIHRLNGARVPVRLCKGAYQEPPELAIPDKIGVDENYVRLMCLLLEEGTDPALATHDQKILTKALTYIGSHQIPPTRFEFEMLYGVRRDLQKMLVDRGYRLRLYVPYGDAWYPYFMRRLAERPANVWFVLRNMLRS